MISNFVFSRTPEIQFGVGAFKKLPQIISRKGKNILLILGASSFKASSFYEELIQELRGLHINFNEVCVKGEPSPQLVDETVEQFKKGNIDLVVSIGGGSVIDAGKAISAMLPQEGSVLNYLEGRETKKHNGIKVPFIAVPTAYGTGAETTKNAVLSQIGDAGFKSSLRHDNFIPDSTLIDPQLSLTCPQSITAACGLDALTQLLESYASTNASPMTDALAWSGLEKFKSGFLPSYLKGEVDIKARTEMAYAAMLSGVTLANAGLGIVHGLASPIGGFYNIPHGVVCGTLLGAATKMNIKTLLKEPAQNPVALEKYAKVGALFGTGTKGDLKKDCDSLIVAIDEWIELTKIPSLREFGITAEGLERIIEKTSNKNNPVSLTKEQIRELLESRL